MTERPTVSVIREWKEHPAKMVFDLFGVKPDPWQERVLEAFPHNQRLAMKACKGPGKTALLTWLAWNFLLTRPYPKIAPPKREGKRPRQRRERR